MANPAIGRKEGRKEGRLLRKREGRKDSFFGLAINNGTKAVADDRMRSGRGG